MRTAERQPLLDRKSHAQRIRSTRVKRRAGRRDRSKTGSWWRRAMISRCNEARDRTTNPSEWSNDTRTESERRPVDEDDDRGGVREPSRCHGF